jgi:F-type H+-transporting ATPase subunit epsilon
MQIKILTPEKTVFNGSAESLQLPGSLGLMGVLNNHAPILSVMTPGIIKFKSEEKNYIYCVSYGFFEFITNKALILADAIEKPEEIDGERVINAIKKAKQQLKDKRDIDVERAQRALFRALNRKKALSVIGANK